MMMLPRLTFNRHLEVRLQPLVPLVVYPMVLELDFLMALRRTEDHFGQIPCNRFQMALHPMEARLDQTRCNHLTHCLHIHRQFVLV